MGFNLELFFEELLESLAAMSGSDNEKELENLIKEVRYQQEYAKECGQIGD